MRMSTAKKKAKANKGGSGNYLDWRDDGSVDIWIGCNDPNKQVAVRHVHFIPYENEDGESKKHKVVCDSECSLDKFLNWLKSDKDIDEDDTIWNVAGDEFTKTDLLKWEGGDWKKAMWPKSETLFSVIVEEDGEFINKILTAGPGLFESISDVVEEFESESGEDFFEGDPCCIRLIYKEKAAPAKKYRAKEMPKIELPDEVKEILDSGEMLEPDDFVEYTDDGETVDFIQANLDGIDWEPEEPKKKGKKAKDKKKPAKKKPVVDEEDEEEEKPKKKPKKKPIKKAKKKAVEEEEKSAKRPKKKSKKKDDDVTVQCPSCDKETSLDEDDCEHCGESIVGF